jgi:metal-sulfur cluster biosynthetic enzyme
MSVHDHDHAGHDHAGHDHAGHAGAAPAPPASGHDDLPAVDVERLNTGGTTTVDVDDVTEAMKDVVDPELGINVVDLGLLYGVHLEDDHSVVLDMTLTSAACPLTDVIMDQTHSALEGLVSDVVINWVWMPPWGPDKITDDGREQLRALGFNV